MNLPTDTHILHSVRAMAHTSGGVSVAIHELLSALAAEPSNHKLHLTALQNHYKITVENESSLSYDWHPMQASTFLQLHSSLQQFIKKTSPTPALVHDHGIWLPNNYSIAAATQKAQIPRVVSVHGMLEPWSMNFRKFKKQVAWQFFQKNALKTAQVIHATAEQEAQNILQLGLNVPVAVIPLGVTVPQKKMERQVSNKKTILFLSRIQQKKGLKNLVYAWDKIRDENWQIIIAGPDENGHRSEIENLINKLKLGQFFKFTGNLDNTQKWQYYANADLFVLPSFSENFGIVIAEALVTGTPVITTKATPWESIATHDCGWWIEVGALPLEKTLREAIKTPSDVLLQKGKNGSNLMKERYNWQRTAEDMHLLYDWILNKAERPSFVFTDS